jgi:hypothetical protein
LTGNAKIRSWLGAGHIADAILGDGAFFIPDVDDSTAHDRLLVLGQLLDWADEQGQWEAAMRGVADALDRSLSRHEPADVLDIAISLLTLADHGSWQGSIPWRAVRDRIAASGGKQNLNQERRASVLARLDIAVGEQERNGP